MSKLTLEDIKAAEANLAQAPKTFSYEGSSYRALFGELHNLAAYAERDIEGAFKRKAYARAKELWSEYRVKTEAVLEATEKKIREEAKQ